ncbi:protein pigeon isoform X1 [Manduca sexta]|uniref:protein pigeon isoform X1 n=2 Tax=Manduca sexta TaxID=7130 RepID=UPI00188F86DB|nr:protein pigeon isoform X1 [Manduca sexta]XP_037298616.1 protein pigeon isoform X1 [Manduca sexta]
MAVQNLAVKLCGILETQLEEEVTAREWRLLGQEQDGSQILTWISTAKDDKEVQNIGVYANKTKTLSILHTFDDKLNIIQASVNATHTLLAYVVKTLPTDDSEVKEPLYCPFLICLLPDKERVPEEVEECSTKQIMLQYVYGKTNKYSPGIRNDRFLLFKHLECIKIYRTPMFLNEFDDGTEKWGFDGIYPEPETIVKVFSWAQWDCVNQVLYYIHFRQSAQSFAEGEEVKSPSEATPTLSALQFHADLPHETVMNIPLSLPNVSSSSEGAACGAYEDDPIPLRVHDCSLDLQIVCDQRGILCICHHYLYKPLDDSTTSLVMEDSADLKDSGVNFAYSITLLQHGCVVHSVVPDLPWALAKSLRPSYTLYEDNHLLVNIPMLYTHLIDISLYHEPCCHIVIPVDERESGPSLAPILGWGPHAMVDLNTLDIVTVSVADKDLAATFKSNTAIENKLAIMHYLILHEGNMDLAEELVSWSCVSQREGLWGLQRVLQEYLVGTTHALTRRSLPASALPLCNMLPFTLHLKFADVKVRNMCVSVSQEKLWNSAAVVLAPRQRVCQFAEDVWTRVWARLTDRAPPRLAPQQVLDKLRVSLHCYQPEALSRCSTPLSPSAAGPALGAPQRRSSVGSGQDLLPFFELDVCTASKQEHIIAANLREVSVHLMRECSGSGGSSGAGGAGAGGASGGGGRGVESGVHAVATRWASAQLDASRALCRAVTRAAAAAPAHNQHRGFTFIDEMEPTHAFLLFKILEQYYLAADSIAFPLPQGFSSFFTYLGYRALPFHAFVQYVHRNVFELQIDVMKAIIACKDDESKTAVNNKLRLIQLVGEGRARRALAAWGGRAALLVRARDHAATLLSGGASHHHEHARHRPLSDTAGIAALPSGERLSPLDTFLDLLTAKASLNELDFNLIIEATLASVQQDNSA